MVLAGFVGPQRALSVVKDALNSKALLSKKHLIVYADSGNHNRTKWPQNCTGNIRYTALLLAKYPSSVAANKIYFINVFKVYEIFNLKNAL